MAAVSPAAAGIHNTSMETFFDVAGIADWRGFHPGGYRISVDNGVISGLTSHASGGRWGDCIALPGLVQTHLHLGQTLFRGMAEGRTLLPWLKERIWPLEASHDEDTLASSVILSLKELFSAGCTGLLDMGVLRHSRVTVDILRRAGARALCGNSLMDTGPPCYTADLGWLMEESAAVAAACGDTVGYVYTPRFALSCSPGIWEWMAGLPPGTPRTTHASESTAEMEHPLLASAGGNVKYLHEMGFTGASTLLAHCVHLQEGEAEILRSTGTTVVHCPWANLRLGSGIADVPALAASGVRVTVACDGAACNNRLDLAGDVRLAMGTASVKASPSSVDSTSWFHSVTEGAARALGWHDVGRLDVGWRADLVLLRPSPVERDELPEAEDPLRYLLELPWPERTVLTMIDGLVVYEEKDFPSLPPLPMELRKTRKTVLERALTLETRV